MRASASVGRAVRDAARICRKEACLSSFGAFHSSAPTAPAAQDDAKAATGDADKEEAERLADMHVSSIALDLQHQVRLKKRVQYHYDSRKTKPLVDEKERELDDRNRIDKRRWLTHNEAPGSTPYERERNAQKIRLARAQGHALDYERKRRNEIDPHADKLEFDKFNSFVEARIQMAMAEGEFDKLSNKGKPLKRLTSYDNPFVNAEDRWAFNMMQNHGFSPDWVENQKSIQTDLENAKEALRVAERRREDMSERWWRSQLEQFKRTVDELNRRIVDHNLTCPSSCQLRPLDKFKTLMEARRGTPATAINGSSASAQSASAPVPSPTPSSSPFSAGTPLNSSALKPSPLKEVCKVSFDSVRVTSLSNGVGVGVAGRGPSEPSVWDRISIAFASLARGRSGADG
ncbi:unnamed protein product [Vitrella brassicaformis CCMP3155]|uniref:DnaJ homologue subfamily C member 28 conserved domain-containing protein n=1 Tax=Vitrella brassicaformis (strain CCMP3155) TaxID=1169540 RepID=A0A0G4H296_VITBC|nr:unnamed protein product [Vitrella brassicaformis CCMP3155]|eukprot:CEM37546.1 unnamed protein product [Vitrella brassicaformis CCMP3155]